MNTTIIAKIRKSKNTYRPFIVLIFANDVQISETICEHVHPFKNDEGKWEIVIDGSSSRFYVDEIRYNASILKIEPIACAETHYSVSII